jgi:ribosomal protein L32
MPISNPVCAARGYHDWRTTKAKGLDRCASCGHTRLANSYPAETTKRYQVNTDWLIVIDSWTGQRMGNYSTLAKAQARARTLNSRNGGK